MKNEVRRSVWRGLTHGRRVTGAARGSADRNRVGQPVIGVQSLQLVFETMVDRPVLSGIVGDDQDLGAALLENQLRCPGARLLEGSGVLVIQQLPQVPQPGSEGWGNEAVR